MRLFLITLLLVFSFVLAQDSALVWYTNIEQAFQAAQETNKLLFVDVSTTWCSWCKKLEQETFTDPSFIETAAQFILLKVDGDQETAFCTKYQVRAYPTMLFLKKDGTEVHRIKGFVKADVLVPAMLEVLKNNPIQTTIRVLPWFTDIQAAFQNATATNRIIFVDCYTEWCSWCKKLEQETFSTAEFQAISAQFVLLKVDGDKQIEFCTKYKVRAYPTMLFLNAEGTELKRILGFVPATTLVPVMKEMLGK